MKRIFLSGLCTLLCFSLLAQGTLEAEFAALINAVPSEITLSKSSFRQNLRVDPAKPYTLFVEQVEGEGRSQDLASAEINLAFVQRTGGGRASGGKLPVVIYADPASVLITNEDGELDYADEFELITNGVDNAREIEAIVARILPLARQAFERSANLPTDIPGLQKYLSERVVDVVAEDEKYIQTLKFGADGLATYTLGGSGNNELNAITEFIVGDLQELKTELKPRGGLLELRLLAREGREYVEVREADRKRFNRDLSLVFADYATAQLVNQAFRKLIPLAATRDAQATPKLSSVAQAATQLLATIGASPDAESSQSFTLQGCTAVHNLEERGSTNTKTESKFDFSDIDSTELELRARGSSIELLLSTHDRERYIAVLENGAPDGYQNSLGLKLAGPTAAKLALAAAEYLTEHCKGSQRKVDMSAAIALANVKRFAEGEDEQTLTAVPDKTCSYTLVLTERTGSRSTVTKYFFNLGDLDPRAVEIKISGTEVELEYGTRGSADLVEEVAADGDRSFEDQLTIRFASVENARVFQRSIETVMEGCAR